MVGPRSFSVKAEAKKKQSVPKKRKVAVKKTRKRRKKNDGSAEFEVMLKGAVIAIKAQSVFENLSKKEMRESAQRVMDELF